MPRNPSRPIPPSGLAPCFGSEMARLGVTDPGEIRRRMDWVLKILPEQDTPRMREAMAVYTYLALKAAGLLPPSPAATAAPAPR